MIKMQQEEDTLHCLACDTPITEEQLDMSCCGQFCEGCDGHFPMVYCEICGVSTCDEPECKHLVRVRCWSDWAGCGALTFSTHRLAETQKSLWAVLDCVPKLAGPLLHALRKPKLLRLREWGPLFGTSTLEFICGRRDWGRRFWPSDADVKLETSELALAWLWSLDAPQTGKWRRLTRRWIHQWCQARHRRTA